MRISAPKQIMLLILCGLLSIAGLSSCGKRGEPVRPSEIEQSQ